MSRVDVDRLLEDESILRDPRDGLAYKNKLPGVLRESFRTEAQWNALGYVLLEGASPCPMRASVGYGNVANYYHVSDVMRPVSGTPCCMTCAHMLPTARCGSSHTAAKGRCDLWARRNWNSAGVDIAIYAVTKKSIRSSFEWSRLERLQSDVTLVEKDIDAVYEMLFGDARKRRLAIRADQKGDRESGELLSPGQDYLCEVDVRENGRVAYVSTLYVTDGRGADRRTEEQRTSIEAALREASLLFDETFTQLEVVEATIRSKEDWCSLRVVYVPWATGYGRGMSVRVSRSKALAQMGFGETTAEAWEGYDKELENIARNALGAVGLSAISDWELKNYQRALMYNSR